MLSYAILARERLEAVESGLARAGVVNLSQLLTIAQDRLLPPRGETELRPISHMGFPRMGGS